MTSHYEARMEADLDEIRRKVRTVSDLVERQVADAVQALLTVDHALAARVVLGDRQINRRIRQIDHLCHAFIVRHAPSAGHLRYASAVLRLDVALERVGDYAGSICREVARLSGQPPDAVGRDIELIGQQARVALSTTLAAFHSGDVDTARRAHVLADQTDLTLETVIAELLRAAERRKGPLRDIFGLLRIINLLKRVAEQAENISEQTIFVVTGADPSDRVFRILFVDERNGAPSQIAEMYARKAYPKSGSYSSAGWAPSERLDPSLVAFMDERGVDVSGAAPSGLESLGDRARHYHVIVLLQPNGREKLGDVPYRTTVVEWSLGPGHLEPGGLEPEDLEPEGLEPGDFDAVYEAVVVHVQELMTTLAGPDAG
jgi:phosphate transport system protein